MGFHYSSKSAQKQHRGERSRSPPLMQIRVLLPSVGSTISLFFLASQMSTAITTIDRREKNGSVTTVVCLKLASVTSSNIRQSTRMASNPAGVGDGLVIPEEHTLVQIKDTRANDGVKRLRQRQRRVCALLAREEGRKPPATTTWYCEKCSTNSRGLYFMCDGIRNHPSNPGFTCSQIFHLVWRNGEFAPTTSHVRDRVLQKASSEEEPLE
ncbi:hypothetical protein JG688_00009879 [Phytophthora aleatoria]|uniref:PiggyBac transposable element-derived protein 4 C-terminal zinc-ribbon domain-containing protein n=1 Tax=Phytophthora aleatoria TaxID=2496075 RepID=A0A8J5IT56_9STRA|nr:hypothetical protein JG688_00009879 [Phytophthora aleatoria]